MLSDDVLIILSVLVFNFTPIVKNNIKQVPSQKTYITDQRLLRTLNEHTWLKKTFRNLYLYCQYEISQIHKSFN